METPLDPFESLLPIMNRCDSPLSPAEFHEAVNVTFHGFESQDYDAGHQDMWQSLPRQFDLLVADLLADAAQRQQPVPDQLRMLDVGCGTGLATDCILKSSLGPRIGHVTLLDTSTAMLKLSEQRLKAAGKAYTVVHGMLESAPSDPPFDLIITSSVLHHVIDLASFFQAVRQRQSPGGVFLHIQDPNGAVHDDGVYEARKKEMAGTETPQWLARLHPRRILGRIQRELNGTQGKDCISLTIAALQDKGVTRKPLTVADLFRVTDFHVNNGAGIRISSIERQLLGYRLISSRSYGFFGVLEADLSPEFQKQEQQYSEQKDQQGGHIGAIWRLEQA
jgi:SAM-dependent methyltransferase